MAGHLEQGEATGRSSATEAGAGADARAVQLAELPDAPPLRPNPHAAPPDAQQDDPLTLLVQEFGRTREPALREEAILACRELVERLALRYRYAGEPMEDVVQEGTLGLISAVEMYDATRGARFATYASHAIQGAIQHYLRDKGKLIREPGWLHDLNHRIDRARARLHHTLGREPTVAEVSRELAAPEGQVAEALRSRHVFRVSSLDQPSDDGEATSSPADRLLGRLQDTGDEASPLVDRLALEEALARLKQTERQVIHDFFYAELSKTEIARKLGCNCGQVSHVLRRALRKLRDELLVEERNAFRQQLRSLEGQLETYARRVQTETIRDELTGLYTGDYVLSRIDEEIARCQRYGHAFAVVLVAIAGIEALRSQSPQVAEEALRSAASVITRATRRIDRVGRCADDRFLMLLPHTGEQATVVCQRLHELLGRQRVEVPGSRARGIRCACGVALYPLHGDDAASLLGAATDDLRRVAAGEHPIQRDGG